MKRNIWFICGCVWLFLVTTTYGEEKIKFLPIKPVPTIEKQDESDNYKIEHDINEVQDSGMVNRIAEDLIVINHKSYKLALDVTIYSAEREPLTRSDIRVNSIVGWQMNDKGQISTLWKLADDPEG